MVSCVASRYSILCDGAVLVLVNGTWPSPAFNLSRNQSLSTSLVFRSCRVLGFTTQGIDLSFELKTE